MKKDARLQPRRLIALGVSVVLAGCAVTPEPLTTQQVRERYSADQFLLYAEQEPITAPIDLDTAVARALKYNLDYRLKLMERALAEGLWDVSRYDMLPRLVASAGYTTRSNDAGGTSVSIINGAETLSPSTSVERSRMLANAEFSWNLLDFGVSYYRAKQLSDETLISEERRRRVIQNIVQDVRAAYWRAAGAQRLAKESDALLERVRDALEKSRLAESQGLMPPTQALAYQRALLDATTLLNIRRQELAFSKRELGALMNVTPGTDFELADEAEFALPQPPRNIGELEEIALENRPELREEDYRKRISVAETRRALLSLLPGLSFEGAYRYDSNKYLYNQSWAEGGLRIFANLFRLTAYPATDRANQARLAADDARRTALSMAVITQVRVAVQRYELSLVDLELADEAAKVDDRLAQYAKAAMTTRVDSELEVIRTESRAMIARYQRYASYANAQVAYARIMNSLGLDVLPDEVKADDVRTLAGVVRTSLADLERDTFPPSPVTVNRVIPPLRVEIENVSDPAMAQAAREAATRALQRAGYAVDPSSKDAWPLRMRLQLAPARDGLQRGEWQITLQRTDGSTVGSTRYGAALASNFQASTLSALTEAATVSQLRSISGWLRGDAPGPKSRPAMRLLARLAAIAIAAVAALPAGAQQAGDDIRVLLTPELETTLVSPMLGRIRAVNVTLGSSFQKGRVLVDFDCQEQQARVAMGQAELVGARENHEAKLRLQGLQQAGDVEVNLAAAAVDKAQAQLELYRTQASQCVVAAPFSGRAVKVHVKAFQGVQAGAPLVEIVSSGALKLRMNVPSKWLAWLKAGTPFEVTVDETGRKYAGRVTAINARVDAASQSIEVEGSIDNRSGDLLAGMSGSARFTPPR